MFHPGHWAAAFINSLEREDAEKGVQILKILAPWLKTLPGEVFGTLAAKKVEKLIRNALSEIGETSPAGETALRFLCLMVKKNKSRYIDSVIITADKIMDKEHGVIAVSLESAMPIGEEFESALKETLKKVSRADRVDLSKKLNPELIGGYRLKIGDSIIDASIRTQLEKLEIHLSTLQESSLQGSEAQGGING